MLRKAVCLCLCLMCLPVSAALAAAAPSDAPAAVAVETPAEPAEEAPTDAGTPAAEPLLSEGEPVDLSAMGRDELLAYYRKVAERLRASGYYAYVSLGKNQTGEEVTRLQARLLALGWMQREPNGKFDTATGNAMKKFEKASGLKVDGAASIEDQTLLFSANAASAKPADPATPATEGDHATEGDPATPATEGDPAAPANEGDPAADSDPLSAMERDALLAEYQRVTDCLRETGYYPYVDLGKNQTGEEVIRLQKRLSELGYLTREPNGKYDTVTLNAVKEFEKANGLKTNGIASIEDQGLLFSSGAVARPTPTPNLTKLYAKLDYAKVMKTPDDYVGKKLYAQGSIMQVMFNEQTRLVRLRFSTKGSLNVVYATYTLAEGETTENLRKGARVAVYGKFAGLFSYTANNGDSYTLPHLEAEYVR